MGKVVCKDCGKPIHFDDTVCVPLMRPGWKRGWWSSFVWSRDDEETVYSDYVKVYCRECAPFWRALHIAIIAVWGGFFLYSVFASPGFGFDIVMAVVFLYCLYYCHSARVTGEKLLKKYLEEEPAGSGEE